MTIVFNENYSKHVLDIDNQQCKLYNGFITDTQTH